MKRILYRALLLPWWLLVIAGCSSPSISGNILVNDRLPDDSLRNRLKVFVEYGEGQKVRSTGVKVENDGWRFKIKVNPPQPDHCFTVYVMDPGNAKLTSERAIVCFRENISTVDTTLNIVEPILKIKPMDTNPSDTGRVIPDGEPATQG